MSEVKLSDEFIQDMLDNWLTVRDRAFKRVREYVKSEEYLVHKLPFVIIPYYSHQTLPVTAKYDVSLDKFLEISFSYIGEDMEKPQHVTISLCVPIKK